MKNTFRRGLFHPDDIKTTNLGHISPGPKTAPLPDLMRKRSRQSLSPIGLSSSGSPAGPLLSRSHSRSSSFANSLGRSEAKRVADKSAEFCKYAESEDEDYDDVFFAKANGSSLWFYFGVV